MIRIFLDTKRLFNVNRNEKSIIKNNRSYTTKHCILVFIENCLYNVKNRKLNFKYTNRLIFGINVIKPCNLFLIICKKKDKM